MSTRAPYTGPCRKLVLAFDVGTTYSGVSYSILEPGAGPEIHPVTRFPAQTRVGANSKIPTVVYYDQDGVSQAIGAETETEGIEARAAENRWVKAEWFKLHLRPRTRTTASVSEEIPPLPNGKTAINVFADFLRYLNQCARSYIEETHMEGSNLLRSPNVEYILSHPNGWEGPQQTLMRRAAIQAELIADTPSDRQRILFVTEGEASLNFCIEKRLMNDAIRQGEGVTIVDAGGGTLDISAYAPKEGSTNEFEEVASAQCHFKGSIFVTRAAERYLTTYLADSPFCDDVSSMADKFDKSTKLSFRNPQDVQYIRFGSARDRDPSHNIRNGQLKLDGTILAEFFEPSIQCIVEAVLAQKEAASKPISTVFLVGGFANSDYLYPQLKERLQPHGLDVYRPDGYVNKAVADGAIAGYLRPYVRARVARFTYGTRCARPYDPLDPDHARYAGRAYRKPTSGRMVISGGFASVLTKNTQVLETQEFRVPLLREAHSRSELTRVDMDITYYRGNIANPKFIDDDPGNFHDLFTMSVDVTALSDMLQPRIGTAGNTYYKIEFQIVLLFGSTEFTAQCAWKEEGTERRSPAEIIYDVDNEIEYDM